MYSASPGPERLDHQEAVDQFNVSDICFVGVYGCSQLLQNLVKELEAVLIQLPVQSLALLPANHSIRQVPRQILFLAANSVDSSRTALQISQKIVQLLYKTPSQLGREIYVALLDQLCHSFENVAKEAINWLIYAEDEVRQHVLLAIDVANVAPSANTTFLPQLLSFVAD